MSKNAISIISFLILLVVLVFGALAIYGVGFGLFFNEIRLRRVK